ncbi:hypothetical protein [Roseicella aquatilis]|uniref:Uncharacterized protein n=1 Tax=Roseicella aquatilis TaxID=2527868 RepID=A0A4R4D3S0_9PROT|nr:hypothetical protein [Roseicella aquatilis]TCZ53394.1 hypothetical protein EXY23_24680 [Roseicella aquatilis]
MGNITVLTDADLDAISGGIKVKVNIASGNTAVSGSVVGDIKKAKVDVDVKCTGDANAGNIVVTAGSYYPT